MKKMLTDKEETIGKTVEKIVATTCPDSIAIHFTDQTAYVIAMEEDYDGEMCFVFAPAFTKTDVHMLGELGLITSEEYEGMWEKITAAKKVAKEKSEREQYECLKAKFDG